MYQIVPTPISVVSIPKHMVMMSVVDTAEEEVSERQQQRGVVHVK